MSTVNLDRRRFLNMRSNDKTSPIRPPWAMDEMDFLESCTRCGDCLEKCPENILLREGMQGYPLVDFKLGECTFCGECVNVCPTTALNRSHIDVWQLKAHIGEQCLASNHVVCQTCSEQCDVNAIRFVPVAGAIALPSIFSDLCTGCGACVAPCPTQSIEVYA